MILSIVVPVYNVENYLSKCLDSILNQDIAKDDYEIVVVNDGSTDNSGEIARGYASRYPNIILINQENQGLSGARNSGIRVAKGKYIQFVDSDDYLEPNVEKSLVERMESEKLDILRFNYQNVNEKGEVFDPNKAGKLYVDYRDEVCDGITFLNERQGPACYAVQFMLKTELVKSIPLFREGICFEDTEWTPRILMSAHRVTSVDRVVYDYVTRQGSITHGVGLGKRLSLLDDMLKVIDANKELMQTAGDRRWFEGMIANSVVSIVSVLAKHHYSHRKKYLDMLKENDVFPLSLGYLTPFAARKAKLINFSPAFACWLLHLKNG